jgi:hypothetical protein
MGSLDMVAKNGRRNRRGARPEIDCQSPTALAGSPEMAFSESLTGSTARIASMLLGIGDRVDPLPLRGRECVRKIIVVRTIVQ